MSAPEAAMPQPAPADRRHDPEQAKQGASFVPTISLPTGGGAIRGIDEKLTVALATGSASLTVPVATSPSRHGFDPDLSLRYDSGSGNGPFGLGWRLSPAAITRKTSRGLPRYEDAADSDTFVLSDVEDLVPALVSDGDSWTPDSYSSDGFAVRRYRPRVEAAFTRIERWTDDATGDTHWRCVSRDNVTSVFGLTPPARIADPERPERVFSWLLEISYDGFGNAIAYEYKPEDGANVIASISEQSRALATNRYLKRIRYGPTTPYETLAATRLPAAWSFEVVLDYGEHGLVDPTPEEAVAWPCRADAFSTYRAGFEVRTRRLCRRILMFHAFPAEMGADPVLVTSTDLAYTTDAPADPSIPVYSLLNSITRTGYLRDDQGGYRTKSVPPLEIQYSATVVDDVIHTADAAVLANLPAGVDNTRWQWADLDGEGLQGVLTSDDRAWYYMRNVSAFSPDGSPLSARFEPIQTVAGKPAGTRAANRLSLVDLHGDGRLAAVDFDPPSPGYHARSSDGSWAPFSAFPTTAAIDFADPNVRRVDLDGDGLADVLMTADDAFTWFAWRAENGFAVGGRVATTYDEDAGPALVLAQSDASIYLADMTGDGLSDLVRIRNGEVCYWPNLGYGRFGPKVIMDAAPWFDTADVFSARRVQLADVDGSGTADLIYLGTDSAQLWFNQSGNGYSEPTTLSGFPGADSSSTVSVIDLFGSGTTCLVWSSPLPASAGAQLRYLDLMGGTKPHLLTTVTNNLGAVTTLEYKPSTAFYLQDRLAGRPWATRLAFPVQVVTRKESRDVISGGRFVSVYTYHHGYFDGVEREFRGFAMVEQSDADFVPTASGTGTFTETPAADGVEFALAPARTCTWFHTGAYLGSSDIAAILAGDYYTGDAQAGHLGSTVFPDAMTAEDMREACRALRGRVLRSETYADDGSSKATVPYLVSENRYQVRLLQPALSTSYGSYVTCDQESVAYHYERNPSDPRVSHILTLEIDDFATVRKSASIGYPRRVPLFDEQSHLLATYTEHDVTHVTEQQHWYRLAVDVESRGFELGGLTAPAGNALFDPAAVLAFAASAVEIRYEQAVSCAAPEKRLTSRSRSIYRSDDLMTALAAGEVQSLALLDRSYRLTMTPGAATTVYGTKVTVAQSTAIAVAEGGYADPDADGSWWAPSAQAVFSADPANPDQAFAAAHFYLPQGQLDAFGALTSVEWEHDLVPVRSTDAVGNVTTAAINYRVLRPWLITDANGNRSGVRFDELGMVVADAVMGKALAGGTDEADHLDLTTSEASAGDDPTRTLDYDLDAFTTWAADLNHDSGHPIPVYAHTRSRVRHKDPSTPWLESYSYSDGFGRIALTKAQAEPGAAPQRDADGDLVRDGTGALVFADTASRWVGTGRTVFDNKANPVKSYEPFFDSTSAYESEIELVQWGVTAITRYDPLSRVVRVDKPDGTYTAVDFGPWRQLSSDENDNVLTSDWYSARIDGGLGAAQQDAATKAAAQAQTPLVSDFDTLGRVFRTVADGESGQFTIRHVLDIQANIRTVLDSLGRAAMTSEFDLSGNTIHTLSIDAGERWTLDDVEARPLRQWDSRNQQLRHTYDAARRPLDTYLTVGEAPEVLCVRVVYGEGQPDDVAGNLRGAAYQQHDGAGVATTATRDLHGDPITALRQLTVDPTTIVDWKNPPTLSGEVLATTTAYDALRRVVSVTTPDTSITRPIFNERSLLAAITVTVPGSTTPTAFVVVASYDPKGQRQTLAYGNGAVTSYTYEPDTFRLSRLVTTRPSGGNPLQDVTYTYDPVGNVTRAVDAAQSTIFFANQLVAPAADFTYDVVYRLLRASGREHIGQTTAAPTGADDSPRRAVPLPTDSQAMRNYTETYSYDVVGNFASVAHAATGGSWTRAYRYDEANPAATNDRLTSSQVGATVEPYTYDANGNITSMPHLSVMSWDYRNLLQSTAQQAVNAGSAPATWYGYDSPGARVRKSTTRADGTIARQRVYLGAYELYREFAVDGTVSLERQTLIVPDGARQLAILDTTTADSSKPPTAPVTTTRYQLADRLGSSCVELDGTAAVVTYEEYYPYGSTSFQAGRSQAEVSLKRYRFTARERDDENGFSYHGARYYAPWLGRWTSCDPAGLVDGTGVYTYARANPVRLVDPAGTDGDDPDEAVQPPASSVLGNSINPPGAVTGSVTVGASGTLASQSSGGITGQEGVVVGVTDTTQLQLQAGPLLSGQRTTPRTSGTLFNGQFQLNFSKDPSEVSHSLVLSPSLAYASAGGTDASSGGVSATFVRERTLRAPRIGDDLHLDLDHPELLSDLNVSVGVSKGTGALTANSTFASLSTATLAYSRTWSSGYYSDALHASGYSGAASKVPQLAYGLDAYATVGAGHLKSPTGAGLGETGTVSADVFGALTSRRYDAAHGPGNTRLTVGLSVGAFVTVDSSGPSGLATGFGVRAVVSFSVGRGAQP
jgi:RHS repeat-associated protein